jgi:GntR family transcriptional regulator
MAAMSQHRPTEISAPGCESNGTLYRKGAAVPSAIDLAELGVLDGGSRLPLYAQLAGILSKRIRQRQAALAGCVLPSELETAAHFKISRPTVRQAMSQLHSEGLIIRGRGRGTFVAPPRASRDLGRAFEFDLLPANHNVEFRLLKRERILPGPAIRELFKLGRDEPVERIGRVRLANGAIFGIEERFLPVRYAAAITDSILEREAGVVFARRLIEGDNGRVVFRVRAIPADAQSASLLKVKRGAPLLSSEHTYYGRDAEPVLHGTVLFRGDRYDFSFQAPVHGMRDENGSGGR